MRTIFVTGFPKTATSTMVAILNSHPDVYCLYETRLDKLSISKYGNSLLKAHPECRNLFGPTSNIKTPYLQFGNHLNERTGSKYKYIGDKILCPDLPGRQKSIFMVRDIRTWLVKDYIVKQYRTELDISRAAVEYLIQLIKSHQNANCIRVKMEDLIHNNRQTISRLSEFMGIDFSYRWRRNINNDKNQHWLIGHPSSKLKPRKLDTKVNLSNNAFWDEYLPIFDKYYSASGIIDPQNDINRVRELLHYSPVPLIYCYNSLNTKTMMNLSDKIKHKIILPAVKRIRKEL